MTHSKYIAYAGCHYSSGIYYTVNLLCSVTVQRSKNLLHLHTHARLMQSDR